MSDKNVPNSKSKFKENHEKHGKPTPEYDAKLWSDEFENEYHVEEIDGKLKITQTKGNEPFDHLSKEDLQKIEEETQKAVAPRYDSQGNPIKLDDIKQSSWFK